MKNVPRLKSIFEENMSQAETAVLIFLASKCFQSTIEIKKENASI